MAKNKDCVAGILLALLGIVILLARFWLYNERGRSVNFGTHAMLWDDFRLFAVIMGFSLTSIIVAGRPMRYTYLLIGLFIGFIMIYEWPLYGVGGEHLFKFYWSGK